MSTMDYIKRWGLSMEQALEVGITTIDIGGIPHISIPVYTPEGVERGRQYRRANSDTSHEWRWRRSEDPVPTIGCWNLDKPGTVWVLESPSDGLSLLARGEPCVYFTGVKQSCLPENIEEAGRWIGNRLAVVAGDNDEDRPINWGHIFNVTVSEYLGLPIVQLPRRYKDLDEYINRKGG